MKDMKQFILTCVFNDLGNKEEFKEVVEEFKRKVEQVSVGDFGDPTKMAIVVRENGVDEIGES